MLVPGSSLLPAPEPQVVPVVQAAPEPDKGRNQDQEKHGEEKTDNNKPFPPGCVCVHTYAAYKI